MNIQKLAIIIGAAVVAGAANAQFGAASRADLEAKAGTAGGYGFFSPFSRVSGGGASATGTVFAYERLFGADARVGGFFTDFEGQNTYQLHYRKTYSENLDLQLGLLSGTNFNNKVDFSLLAFTTIAKADESKGQTISAELFGGLYRESIQNKTYFQFGVKASYPLQERLSVDVTYWNIATNPSQSQLAFGIGYRF